MKVVCAVVALVLTTLAIGQANGSRKQLTARCYWNNSTARANYHFGTEWMGSNDPDEKARGAKLLNNLYGCDEYQEPTHCSRTGFEMMNEKRHWARVIDDGVIYTIVCGKCKRSPTSGSYDAETDGKSMWLTFETPDKRNIIEKFDIVDVSPMKVQ